MHRHKAWADLVKVDQPVALRALVPARVALAGQAHLVRQVPVVLHAQVSRILVRQVLARLRAQLQALLAQAQALAEAAVAELAAEQPVPSAEAAARETVPDSQSARNAKNTSRDRLLALAALSFHAATAQLFCVFVADQASKTLQTRLMRALVS